MLRVSINGASHSCVAGTILSALRRAGVRVPTLCDDPRLAPIGGCRLCLVTVNHHPHPVAACTAPLVEGMEIETHTAMLESLRCTQLRLLARHYPREALDRPATNEFLRWVGEYGLTSELGTADVPQRIDDSHPCIHVDMSRCIECYRCVRICEEVAGRFVWRAWGRGDRTEIRPHDGLPLVESNCVSCGACVDTCPSGALLDQTARHHELPTAEVRTVCPYCGTGCEIHAQVRDGRLVGVRPVLDSPVNHGHLCVKGRYGWEFVHSGDRATQPMIRRDESWEPVAWQEAIGFVAGKLTEIVAQHGPQAVGMLGSSRATNEENYVTQKFARVVLESNNVDCCARVCHAPTAAGMKIMLGTGAATNSFDDIEQARTILLCGVNPTENHPIVGDRIRQAAIRGTRLIVIDPRRIELAEHAAVHLQLRPGTNIPLLNALAHTIVSEGLCDPTAIAHVEAWEKFRLFLNDFAPEQVAPLCGVEAEAIRQAARLYATHKPSMSFHGLGVTEHVQGTEGVMCLVNLAVITGNMGLPGSGVNPLRGQNNVQGAAHMGCDPGVLTGSVPVAQRQIFETVWNSPVPTRPGLNLMQMMDAAGRGELKALWSIGYDVALTNPNANETVRSLRSLELLVVQDLFLNETARVAGTLFLPACSSFEKDGTFMNSERRIQRVRKAVEPLGESRTDWEILCEVARAMGKGDKFAFGSAEQIWEEIRRVWDAGAGISYRRLEGPGLQWPCPSEDHPGTTILHREIFSGDNPIRLRPINYRPSPEQTSDEFPLLLITGRALYQFNAGNMSGRSKAGLFQPADCLQISTRDAERLNLSDGQKVRISSRYGQVEMSAAVCDRVLSGQLFATFQSTAGWVNFVTSPHRDRFVQTPEYKVCAVRVERVSD
jgi:formate dehydrogenase major subunit